MKSIRSKLILFSVLLILTTALPIILTVNTLINKSIQDGHIRNVTQQVSIIEQMLDVFYDDLDQNIDMFASHQKVRQADRTVTDYLAGDGEMMTHPEMAALSRNFRSVRQLCQNTPGHPVCLYGNRGRRLHPVAGNEERQKL